jgi:hypothetical protein
VTDESIATFLSAGVQLLPVLWLVLAIETTWLSSQLRRAKTASEQHRSWRRLVNVYSSPAQIVAMSFPFGAVAECLALLVLMFESPAGWGMLAAVYLYLALLYSVIASAIAMRRAIVGPERPITHRADS